MSSDKFDLVLYGVTGFTGALLAEHFARKYMDAGVSFAVAGRSLPKINQVLSNLSDRYPRAKTIPQIRCDSSDEQSVHNMVASTRVLMTTVGPYAKYGSLVLQKCAELGVDYVDITGEIQWCRRMIHEYHDLAVANRVRIVHGCGYDSIPTDLTTYFAVRRLKEKYGDGRIDVRCYDRNIGGDVSGGTIASLIHIFERGDPNIDWDPYSLYPAGEAKSQEEIKTKLFTYSSYVDGYTSASLFGHMNVKVIYRSNALHGFPGGRDMTFWEYDTTPWRVQAYFSTAYFALFKLLITSRLGRWFLQKVMPAPGEGPSRQAMEAASFYVMAVGELKKENGSVHRSQCKFGMSCDPGYLGTSLMLLEAGMALVEDREDLPEDHYGVITPSYAFGDVLRRRLAATQFITIETSDL